MSEMLLEINGVPYSGFTEATADISMLNVSGGFSFSVSAMNDLEKFPIKVGSTCRVLVDGQSVVAGYVDKININYGSTDHSITINGRDKTSDIIDSTIGEGSLSITSSISLIDVIKRVLAYLNIKDIKVSSTIEIPNFDETEVGNIKIETGQTAFEFIEKYCQQRQVLPTTDGMGNIVLTQTGDTVLKTVLTSSPTAKSTILNASVDWDFTKRFHKYVLSTQLNPVNLSIVHDLAHPDADQQTSVATTSYDEGIRTTRTLNFIQSENSYNNLKYMQNRAEYEKNFRLSRSFIYNATVQGFSPINDPSLVWRPNYLVKVQDDYCDVDSTLLINSVKFNYSIDNGSTTTLELIDKDSYKTIDVLFGIKYKNKYKQAKEGNSIIHDLSKYQGK